VTLRRGVVGSGGGDILVAGTGIGDGAAVGAGITLGRGAKCTLRSEARPTEVV
jgi:hypothetical protein